MLEENVSLAVHVQAAWRLDDAGTTESTITGFTVPESTGAWLFIPLAWLTRWLPRAPTLLVAQSLGLASGLLPVWRLARRWANLRVGAAAALAVAYAANPIIHNLNLDGFHPVALALPGLLMLVHRGLVGSRVRSVLALLWVLGWAPELALVLVGVGVLFVASQRRRLGFVVVGLAGLMLAGVLTLPWLGSGDGLSPVVGAFSTWGDGAGEVVAGVLSNPVDALAAVTARANFDWAFYLLLPLAFLPLVALRYLAPAVPWFLVVALGRYPAPTDTWTAVAAPLLPFAVLATAAALRKLGRKQTDRVAVHPRLSAGLAGAALVGFTLWATASLYEQPWRWGGRDEADEATLAALAEIRGDEAVAASERLLVSLAGRRTLVKLEPGKPLPPGLDVIAVDRAEPGATQLRLAGFVPVRGRAPWSSTGPSEAHRVAGHGIGLHADHRGQASRPFRLARRPLCRVSVDQPARSRPYVGGAPGRGRPLDRSRPRDSGTMFRGRTTRRRRPAAGVSTPAGGAADRRVRGAPQPCACGAARLDGQPRLRQRRPQPRPRRPGRRPRRAERCVAIGRPLRRVVRLAVQPRSPVDDPPAAMGAAGRRAATTVGQR